MICNNTIRTKEKNTMDQKKLIQKGKKLFAERASLLDHTQELGRLADLARSQMMQADSLLTAKSKYLKYVEENVSLHWQACKSQQDFRSLSAANSRFQTEAEAYLRLDREYVESVARYSSALVDWLEALDTLAENTAAVFANSNAVMNAKLQEYETTLNLNEGITPAFVN